MLGYLYEECGKECVCVCVVVVVVVCVCGVCVCVVVVVCVCGVCVCVCMYVSLQNMEIAQIKKYHDHSKLLWYSTVASYW